MRNIQRLSEFDANGRVTHTVLYFHENEHLFHPLPQRAVRRQYDKLGRLIHEEVNQPQLNLVIHYDNLGRRIDKNPFAFFRQPEDTAAAPEENPNPVNSIF